MRKLGFAGLLVLMCSAVYADFGIQVGAFSPDSGLEDNDNAMMIGAHIEFKLAMVGIKFEGFYVDSSGRYTDALADAIEDETDVGFGSAADIDIEAILAADVMFYPFGTTFFLQLGVNWTALDAGDVLEIDTDVIDNQLGIEGGLGILLFDKLMLQAKVMYTPDAIQDEVVESLENLDSNLLGYMVSVGWQF